MCVAHFKTLVGIKTQKSLFDGIKMVELKRNLKATESKNMERKLNLREKT